MTDAVLDLAQALMRCESVSPEDAGCQAILAERLTAAGFDVTHCPFGDVKNLWATHGSGAPVILFQGHTDVVPPGPDAKWDHPPFSPRIESGRLIGRGACDMKGALSAMAIAAIDFCQAHPDHAGTVAFAATSDEEGVATHGMKELVRWLDESGIAIDYCLTGEPTSVSVCGDTYKPGRRGSLHGHLTVLGKQGHVAYPDDASNAIHLAMRGLAALSETHWDDGSADYPPTRCQLYAIDSGTGANNVIPGQLTCSFNFRYAPCQTAEQLKTAVAVCLDKHIPQYELTWVESAQPFLSPVGKLTTALTDSIEANLGIKPTRSTAGGTSDSRFFAQIVDEVLDFGPINSSAHQANEWVTIDDLQSCYTVYRGCLERLLL